MACAWSPSSLGSKLALKVSDFYTYDLVYERDRRCLQNKFILTNANL